MLITSCDRMDGNLPKPKMTFGVGGVDARDAPPAAVLFLVAEIRVHDDGTSILTVRTRVSIENSCGVPVRSVFYPVLRLIYERIHGWHNDGVSIANAFFSSAGIETFANF